LVYSVVNVLELAFLRVQELTLSLIWTNMYLLYTYFQIIFLKNCKKIEITKKVMISLVDFHYLLNNPFNIYFLFLLYYIFLCNKRIQIRYKKLDKNHTMFQI